MHISIMVSQWSAVSWYRLQLPSLILTVAEGWVKREICSKGVKTIVKRKESGEFRKIGGALLYNNLLRQASSCLIL